MRRRLMVGRVVTGVMVCLMLAALAGAQSAATVTAKDLVGVWEGSAQTPNGEVTLKVEFTLTDGKLASTIESSMGPMPVATTTLTDDKLVMGIEVMGSPASLEAKVAGKRIEGTWTLGADGGPFALTRSGGTDQAPKK